MSPDWSPAARALGLGEELADRRQDQLDEQRREKKYGSEDDALSNALSPASLALRVMRINRL